MSFGAELDALRFDELLEVANYADATHVERALTSESLDLWDFAALLSPEAGTRLETLAQRSHELTVQRFGRTVQLYAPLYVSNECVETCTYCAFSRPNPIARRTLTPDEAVAEAAELRRRGFRHLLLVSGEHPRKVSPDYLTSIIGRLRDEIPSLSVEVQPQTEEVYRLWTDAGAEGLVVYQETYDRDIYAQVHLAGKKKNYDWRLETLDRGAAGGMKRLGIGALFGLADWRYEALALAAHARYLTKKYWRAFVTVSFPRLRPADHADTLARHPLSDRDLARLVCAFRLLVPDLGIVLSTREPAHLRDGLVKLGITQMSAGSKTEPGGYSADEEQFGRQFEIEDRRSASEVSQAIRKLGFDPVWKDWESSLHG